MDPDDDLAPVDSVTGSPVAEEWVPRWRWTVEHRGERQSHEELARHRAEAEHRRRLDEAMRQHDRDAGLRL